MTFRGVAVRWAWGCLALVLLFAPLLGLMHGVMHGVVHGVGGSQPAAASQLHAHSHIHGHGHGHAQDAGTVGHTHEHAGGHGWLAGLFGVHADAADCRVYDQLCHSDLLADPAAPVLPLAFSSLVFHVLERDFVARWAALFEARGPPPLR
jgi:hypothetical protein